MSLYERVDVVVVGGVVVVVGIVICGGVVVVIGIFVCSGADVSNLMMADEREKLSTPGSSFCDLGNAGWTKEERKDGAGAKRAPLADEVAPVVALEVAVAAEQRLWRWQQWRRKWRSQRCRQ